MSTKASRNEPCPCGSGRKAKHCCGDRTRSRPGYLPIIAMIAVAGLVVASIFSRSDESETRPGSASVATPTAPLTPAAQPPGPAPDGKVWSSEHGHWHDAAPVQLGSQIQTGNPNVTASVDTVPPADGEERNGMIWNAAHNHWHPKEGSSAAPSPAPTPIPRHDIPRVTVGGGTATQGFRPVPQPPGPVPEGKVWSSIHGHWHDAGAPAEEVPASTDTSQPQ